jgi:hypothetical protein
MVDESRDDPPELADAADRTKSLMWIYAELIRIEGHWTGQVQDQQRRVAAVLAVNGFLLAFLTSAGIQMTNQRQHGWYFYSFYLCLIFLTIGLFFGVLTLFPQIPIAGRRRRQACAPDEASVKNEEAAGNHEPGWLRTTFAKPAPETLSDALWLDANTVWCRFRRGPGSESSNLDALLVSLCQAASQNAEGNLEHSRTVVRRRRWMNWQIAFIMLSLLLLVVSVFGRAIHVL